MRTAGLEIASSAGRPFLCVCGASGRLQAQGKCSSDTKTHAENNAGATSNEGSPPSRRFVTLRFEAKLPYSLRSSLYIRAALTAESWTSDTYLRHHLLA
jgi:hypothetical protein